MNVINEKITKLGLALVMDRLSPGKGGGFQAVHQQLVRPEYGLGQTSHTQLRRTV